LFSFYFNNCKIKFQLLQINSLEDAVKSLHNEANFAAKNFDAKSISFAKNLNDLINQFDEKLVVYDQLIEHHNSATDYSKKELAALTLIPEKLQDRIEKIVPKLAIEVEQIHSKRLEEIISNIEKLETQLDARALANQQLIENTTAKCIEQVEATQTKLIEACSRNEAVLSTAEKFDQLRRDMQDFDHKRRRSYFIGLGISLVLMAVVAGASTYLTLKYYPTHVNFNRSTEQVTISGSDVSVWGTKQLHIKEKVK
jgi:hypothetical protein